MPIFQPFRTAQFLISRLLSVFILSLNIPSLSLWAQTFDGLVTPADSKSLVGKPVVIKTLKGVAIDEQRSRLWLSISGPAAFSS
jgi:hypothetical protein